MKKLPLFPDLRADIEKVPHVEVPRGLPCGKCKSTAEVHPLYGTAVGQFRDTEPTLLVVGEQASLYESAKARPFSSDSNRSFISRLREQWPGNVVLDYAIRCPTADGKAVAKCQPYIANTLKDIKPDRIICLGARAAQSVLGRKIDPIRLRKNYAFLSDGTPVFTIPDPVSASRNRFILRWSIEDLAWALKETPEDPRHDVSFSVVETREEAAQAVADIRSWGGFAWDVETAGLMFEPSFRIVSISFYADRVALLRRTEDHAYVFRVGQRRPHWLEQALRELFLSEVEKAGSNVKYDILSVRVALGYWPKNVNTDVRLLRKLMDAESPGDLDSMAELVGLGGSKDEHDEELKRVIKELRKNPEKAGDLAHLVLNEDHEPKKWAYGFTNPDIGNRYVARDGLVAASLKAYIDPQLSNEQNELVSVLLRHVPQAFAQMEYWGVPVDREAVTNLENILILEETAALDALKNFKDIDWGSSQQIARYLYDELKLPVVQWTEKGSPSVAAEALELLQELYPSDVIGELLNYRKLSKLRGTYATGLRAHIRSDGRIHPTILPDGARSGRTSCVDPNLQNIPRAQTRFGKMVRDLFVSRPGYKLVELDYSQLELRIAAMLSQDPIMLGIYDAGVDFHQRTAELISQIAWKIPPEQVTDQHRTWAKTVNFGMLYGKTATTFAKEFGISRQEAQAIIDAILGQFKVLAEWKRGALRDSRISGEAWTVWNGKRARRRPLWRIGSAVDGERITAENGAANSPIQGTASDYCVASIVAIVDWILGEGIDAKLILAVHDSIMLEVRDDYVDEVIEKVRNIMEGWPTQGVKLKADVKVGTAWGSLEKRN